jgi:hypothetical protein
VHARHVAKTGDAGRQQTAAVPEIVAVTSWMNTAAGIAVVFELAGASPGGMVDLPGLPGST